MSGCDNNCEAVAGLNEAAANLVQYSKLIDTWLNGAADETVDIGGQSTPTLLALVASIKDFLGVWPDGVTIRLTPEKKIYISLKDGGGLAFDENGLYVDSAPIATLTTPGTVRPDGVTTTVDALGNISVIKDNNDEVAGSAYLILNEDQEYTEEEIKELVAEMDLPDGTICVVYGASEEGSSSGGTPGGTASNEIYVQRFDNYSLNEQRIGTWINGKPLYRSIFEATSNSNVNQWQNQVDLTEFNVEDCVNIWGYTKSSAAFVNFGMEGSNSSAFLSCIYNITNKTIQSITQTASNLNIPCVIIVEYTKTTDQPDESPIYTSASFYRICNVYHFLNPSLEPGFVPCNGGLIENAAQKYPEAWTYLQTTVGQQMCVTEAEWQAMTQAEWGDGEFKASWNGIGGAPKYVQDLEAGTLRVPDLRGMFACAAGDGTIAPSTGGSKGDTTRDAVGEAAYIRNTSANNPFTPPHASGVFELSGVGVTQGQSGEGVHPAELTMVLSRAMPTGAVTAPRSWGALACCYLGQPSAG